MRRRVRSLCRLWRQHKLVAAYSLIILGILVGGYLFEGHRDNERRKAEVRSCERVNRVRLNQWHDFHRWLRVASVVIETSPPQSPIRQVFEDELPNIHDDIQRLREIGPEGQAACEELF